MEIQLRDRGRESQEFNNKHGGNRHEHDRGKSKEFNNRDGKHTAESDRESPASSIKLSGGTASGDTE